MKRYTLCTILFACVACCAQGCGKTEYNDYMNGYAQLKEDCLASGGHDFKYEDGTPLCACRNGLCSTICNASGNCPVCENKSERCVALDDKGEIVNDDTGRVEKKYQICEGGVWHDTGKFCNTGPSTAEENCDLMDKHCEGNELYTCIDKKRYIVTCPDGCDSEKNKCKDPCSGEYEICSNNNEFLEVCHDGQLDKFYCPFGCVESKEIIDGVETMIRKCDDSTSKTCSSGDMKCEINRYNGLAVVYECPQDNQWEVNEICPFKTCDIQKMSCGCKLGDEYSRCTESLNSVIHYSCQTTGISGFTQWEQKVESCLDNFKCDPANPQRLFSILN